MSEFSENLEKLLSASIGVDEFLERVPFSALVAQLYAPDVTHDKANRIIGGLKRCFQHEPLKKIFFADKAEAMRNIEAACASRIESLQSIVTTNLAWLLEAAEYQSPADVTSTKQWLGAKMFELMQDSLAVASPLVTSVPKALEEHSAFREGFVAQPNMEKSLKLLEELDSMPSEQQASAIRVLAVMCTYSDSLLQAMLKRYQTSSDDVLLALVFLDLFADLAKYPRGAELLKQNHLVEVLLTDLKNDSKMLPEGSVLTLLERLVAGDVPKLTVVLQHDKNVVPRICNQNIEGSDEEAKLASLSFIVEATVTCPSLAQRHFKSLPSELLRMIGSPQPVEMGQCGMNALQRICESLALNKTKIEQLSGGSEAIERWTRFVSSPDFDAAFRRAAKRIFPEHRTALYQLLTAITTLNPAAPIVYLNDSVFRDLLLDARADKAYEPRKAKYTAIKAIVDNVGIANLRVVAGMEFGRQLGEIIKHGPLFLGGGTEADLATGAA